MGVVIGAAADTGVPASELEAAQQQSSSLRDDLAAAEGELGTLRSQRSAVRARESRQDGREQELDQRAAELDAREAAIGAAEREYEENTIPGTGTFLVGEDIAAGTYRTAGSSECYWARLRGTSGDLDDIIANGFAEGPTTLTIAPSDEAFEVGRCAEWRLR
ncbi:hypothetical protein [Pseudonocardia sp.]|uniref:hypothetical protein n=1 Tax=Pseudonocardia sp. TaxID=60912 RepID=UPI00261C03BE|nr:hypothetical protein [Pseudonocardia sp.]